MERRGELLKLVKSDLLPPKLSWLIYHSVVHQARHYRSWSVPHVIASNPQVVASAQVWTSGNTHIGRSSQGWPRRVSFWTYQVTCVVFL